MTAPSTTCTTATTSGACRMVSLDQLEVMNMLVHPVWIFDVTQRRMRWANSAGVEMWNASSLQEVQARDFTDMSESTAKRLDEVVRKCQSGEIVPDQWTFYPKGQAKTVKVHTSGIQLQEDADLPRVCLLYEGVLVEQTELENELLRGVEMLRHLPMAVCQFDMEGKVMFQNPEACLKKDTEKEEETKVVSGDLTHRFVDHDLGEKVLQQVYDLPEQTTFELEAMLHTRQGPTWSAIQVRKSRDPITGQNVLLYSARNRSDAVRAKKEQKAREQMAEFLAIMAHEIRTPLHQVTGFVDLLDSTQLNPEQKGFVGLLKSSSQGLMTVINDVLDYSKLEAGRMKLENIPYEPLAVVKGSMEAVRATCEERGLYLNLEWDKSVPFRLKSDPNRLRQVLLNLLSNACKFTRQGGITIKATYHAADNNSTHENASYVRFVVQDTGIGISPQAQTTIFQKYQQANVTIARNYGGTGLGLPICCLLLKMMGGQMGVDSQLGNGASFWFEIPAKVPSEEDLMGELEDGHNSSSGIRGEGIRNSTMQQGLQILVAEDNKVNQKLLMKMLQRMGHSAFLAENGKEAIEMVSKGNRQFDVCLMDIQMPICDGLEATKRLRSMGHTELPIYALTASVVRSDFSDLGFTGWLPKPIRMKDLKGKLKTHQGQERGGGVEFVRQ